MAQERAGRESSVNRQTEKERDRQRGRGMERVSEREGEQAHLN